VLQVRPVFKFEADTGYQRQLDSGEIRREYEGVTRYLIQECKKRNISLLINTLDPTYQAQSDYQNVVLKAVERYISPEIVWRKDFDWRNETYDEYCQRIDWVRYLWYCLSLSKTRISEQILGTSFVGGTGTYQARFDVI
jgi:hypothetical protein